MKFSTLLQIIGSGSILLIVGVALFLFGLAYGFSAATDLPVWASLTGFGLFACIVGIALVDRGSDEAEEEVKKMPMLDALRSPLWMVGASVIGGLILARLTRKRPVIIEHASVASLDAEPLPAAAQQGIKKDEGFSVSDYLSDQLRQLGTIASGAALSMGMKSLGVPSVEQLIDDLLGDKETAAAPKMHDETRMGAGKSVNMTRASSTTHARNGAMREDEYDPLIG